MAEEVVSGVYDLPMSIVHSYLVVTDEIVLIDSGYPGWSERILQEVARHNQNVAHVGHIILTHYHVDHAGCAADLKKATGARVYAHPADATYIRGEKPHEGPFPRGVVDRLIAPVWFRRSARYRRILKAATIDHELSDGERLPIGEDLEIVHTPGHTPGHISVLMPSKKLLFVGDAAANVFGLRAPVGTMFGLATADIALAKESMRKIAGLDFDIACFGHGRVLRGAANLAFRRYVEKVAR